MKTRKFTIRVPVTKPRRPWKFIPAGQRHTDRKNDYRRNLKHRKRVIEEQ